MGLVVLTILFVVRPENFGEYKQCFEDTKIGQNFYVIEVIIRFCIGFSIILPQDPTVSVCLVLGFLILQLLLKIILRPYITNVRPILNSLVMIVIFSIFTVYGLKLSENAEWMTTNLPILIYSCLAFCILYTLLFIIITIYQKWKVKQTEQDYEE